MEAGGRIEAVARQRQHEITGNPAIFPKFVSEWPQANFRASETPYWGYWILKPLTPHA
jgi:hypothetical protein